ncbi:mechanosensitive ion channel domain-containing protein [Acidisoma sp. 7E03]
MRRFSTLSCPVLLLAALLLMGGAARPALAEQPATAPAAAPALTAAETQQLLSVLQNPQKREQFVTTLKNLEKASAATGAAAAPTAAAPVAAAPAGTAAAPAAPAANGTAAAPAKSVTLQPHSLGADLMSQADTVLAQIAADLSRTSVSLFDIRGFVAWTSTISQDRFAVSLVFSAVWRLAVVMLLALFCEYLVYLGTRRIYARLGRNSGTAEAEARQALHESDRAKAVVQARQEEVEEGAAGTEDESLGVLPATEEPAAEPDVETTETPVENRLGASVPVLPALPSPEDAPAETESDGRVLEHQPEAEEDERRGFSPLRPLHSGWPLLRRLPFILLAMIVDAVPVFGFLAAASVLLATPLAGDILIRLTLGAVINAYALCRLLLVLARGTVCAPTAKLRLLHLSDDAAAFLATWSRRIALVILIGFSVVQIGDVAGMTLGLQNAITRIFSLAIHVMLVVMVLKRRREVAGWLSRTDGKGAWARLKLRLAQVWHWQAAVLIMLLWVLFATEVTNHVQHPTRLILSTIGLLLVFRVLHIVMLGALEKAFSIGNASLDGHYAMIATRAARYHRPLRYLVNVAVILALVLSLLRLWDLRAFSWLSVGDLGDRLFHSLGTIGITLVLAIVIWETLNFFIQIYLDDLTQQGLVIRAARLRTILPLLRNTLLVMLLALFVLTAMSEVGVNIGPLLAGASIFGVALGFGSQKLVQDFINGIFLLLENAMQVGDWVTAAGLSGTVENLSIRTLRLRASDGSVHIIPFSSVTTVTNINKGRGNASLAVTVSYDEDTDRVAELLKQMVLDMRNEPEFQDGILSDYNYWGVDSIDGRVATLMGQVPCTDKMRWAVQRELNRRVKITFQKEGITLLPSGTVMALQHPLDVRVEPPPRPTSRLGAPSGS